ncbi:sulfatase [Pelagicoccus mobilis]|uniref:Sulfatase n=1 Tax=Pelagicoccus mobilis TaxID=415221 RepID=A0A934RYL4_9BACT|nr:sulfatase [Pelagicoccus mobilis]MBK1877246.1 sulfatase [Pelagicoccus mobilis]
MNLLIKYLFSSLLLLSATAYSESGKPLNILFIGVDDLRVELGCYGDAIAKTPNIDKLAKDGLLFERAYVQQAVCAASRASILTGCRPDSTGVDYPYSEYFMHEFRKTRPSIAEFFFDKGYFARTFGKIHHGFEDHMTERHYLPTWNVHYLDPHNVALGKKHKHGRTKETPAFEFADAPELAYKDGMSTAEAIDTMRRAQQEDAPFFLGVGYFKPHLPWVAPKKYWDLYEDVDVGISPVPSLPDGAPDYATAHYSLSNYSGENDYGPRRLSDDRARVLRRAYFACVSFIDAQVGYLMDELDRLDLRDNTIVVFWSDHGWHLGDQGAWGKTTNYEWSTRAPLIVSLPGSTGARTSALVEYVDLYPTLVDLAGFEVPDFIEGTSLRPLFDSPDREWKTAAFSQYPRSGDLEGYAIRTDRYRYVEWWEKEGIEKTSLLSRELYDYESDPLETVNIAETAAHSETVEMLSKQLVAGWRSALPDGISNESSNPFAPHPVAYGPEKNSASTRQATKGK